MVSFVVTTKQILLPLCSPIMALGYEGYITNTVAPLPALKCMELRFWLRQIDLSRHALKGNESTFQSLLFSV